MNWVTDNASWIAWGLFIFIGIFIVGFFMRNQGAKTDKEGPTEKNTRNSNVGIKRSDKL